MDRGIRLILESDWQPEYIKWRNVRFRLLFQWFEARAAFIRQWLKKGGTLDLNAPGAQPQLDTLLLLVGADKQKKLGQCFFAATIEPVNDSDDDDEDNSMDVEKITLKRKRDEEEEIDNFLDQDPRRTQKRARVLASSSPDPSSLLTLTDLDNDVKREILRALVHSAEIDYASYVALQMLYRVASEWHRLIQEVVRAPADEQFLTHLAKRFETFLEPGYLHNPGHREYLAMVELGLVKPVEPLPNSDRSMRAYGYFIYGKNHVLPNGALFPYDNIIAYKLGTVFHPPTDITNAGVESTASIIWNFTFHGMELIWISVIWNWVAAGHGALLYEHFSVHSGVPHPRVQPFLLASIVLQQHDTFVAYCDSHINAGHNVKALCDDDVVPVPYRSRFLAWAKRSTLDRTRELYNIWHKHHPHLPQEDETLLAQGEFTLAPDGNFTFPMFKMHSNGASSDLSLLKILLYNEIGLSDLPSFCTPETKVYDLFWWWCRQSRGHRSESQLRRIYHILVNHPAFDELLIWSDVRSDSPSMANLMVEDLRARRPDLWPPSETWLDHRHRFNHDRDVYLKEAIRKAYPAVDERILKVLDE
jgi:hypothetical protein